ncbi:DUF3545 family protein [Dongshaea marina]|uniref:DUF3545 family protein n=1 Tax=Dongshaea marina TaxID=2047966 RepID=UPI000D3EB3B5|nr:DUF3545 family protein [Dongshaea marina]
MDRFETTERADEQTGRRDTASKKKRRWREIEALKDRYRLQEELRSIDFAFDGPIDDLEF